MAGNYFDYSAHITFFIVFFTMVVAAGGFSDYISSSQLDEYDLERSDLQLAPDIPTGEDVSVDLEFDIFEKENVTVVDTEDYFNGSQEYQTDQAIVLEDNKTKGYVNYNIPRAEGIDTKTQKTSIFVNTRTHLWEGNITGECYDYDNLCTPIRAESSTELTQNESIITVEFDDMTTKEPVLYDIQASTEQPTGLFETIAAYLGSAANALASWLTIITGLPGQLVWLGTAFGIIALLVLIEFLTF